MIFQRQIGRTSGILLAATLSAAWIPGNATMARADELPSVQEASQQNTLVDVDLVEATLPVAVKLIRQRTGLNIVIRNQATQYGTVTVSLKAKPAKDVLRLIAESAGADFWQKDGVFFVGPKGSAPKIEIDGNLPSPATDIQVPAPQRRYEKIRLKYADPQVLLRQIGLYGGSRADALEQYNQSVLFSYLNTARQQPYSTPASGVQVQVAPQDRTVQVAPAVPTGGGNYNNFKTAPQQTGGVNPSSNTDQGAGRDSGGNRDEFGRGGQFGGGGGQFGGGGGGQFGGGGGGQFGGGGGGQFGGGGGQGGGGGFGQGGLGGQGGGGGTAAGLLANIGISPNEIFAFDADNSIIVTSTDENAIRDLRAVIGFLDQKPRQISIKAEFVTVSQNDISSFGINWSFQKVNLVGGVTTGFQQSNTAFLQYAAGNIQAQLSFILTTGRGKLVAAPMVTTLNNVGVQIVFQQQIPYFTSGATVSNGTVVLIPQVNAVTVTSGLVITPRINGDESITLAGSAFIGDTNGFVTGPNGSSVPITINQTAPIQRIIRNGDTMVVGGLIRKRTSVSQNKVPLLGDLPLIGSLFASRNVSVDDSELLVFITPSIIPERAPLAAIGGIGAGGQGGFGGGQGGGLGNGPGAGGGTNP